MKNVYKDRECQKNSENWGIFEHRLYWTKNKTFHKTFFFDFTKSGFYIIPEGNLLKMHPKAMIATS